MVEVQEFEFGVKYTPSASMVVPDALSRDSIETPMCQRCFGEIGLSVDVEETAGEIQGPGSSQALVGGPSTEDLRVDQVREMLRKWSTHGAKNGEFLIDSQGLLRKSSREKCQIIIPRSLVPSVLSFAHGSQLCRHYGVRRTQERIAGQFWWPGSREDAQARLKECVACAGVKASRPTRNAPMQVHHPLRRSSRVAVDVQTVTPRTSRGNIKILVLVYKFTRFAWAVAIPDERAKTIAAAIAGEWVSVFRLMEFVLSNRAQFYREGGVRDVECSGCEDGYNVRLTPTDQPVRWKVQLHTLPGPGVFRKHRARRLGQPRVPCVFQI